MKEVVPREIIYPKSHNKLMAWTGLELKLVDLGSLLFFVLTSAYCYLVVSLCMSIDLRLVGDSPGNLTLKCLCLYI